METYTNFYDDNGIIEYYDKFIDWDKRMQDESQFFIRLLKNHNIHKVLDCAAGTGFHAIMLAKAAFNVIGSDKNAKILAKARENAERENLKLKFYELDWKKLSNKFDSKFDAVICAGNSLPLLTSKQKIRQALSQMYDVLKEGGVLVLDCKNFDRLLRNKKTFDLGAHSISKGKTEIFFHIWDSVDSKIVLYVVYLFGNIHRLNYKIYLTEYYPISTKGNVKLLKEIGFKGINLYGDYKFTKFSQLSHNHIQIIAQK